MTCLSLRGAKTPYKTKQPLSNFEAGIGERPKQLKATERPKQAEPEN